MLITLRIVIICEANPNIVGEPFIITLYNEPPPPGMCTISRFAKNLAHLHSLDVSKLEIEALKAPEDEFVFAKRSLLYFKILLNLLPRHGNGLREYFESLIHWLESNIPDARCFNYCLLHGDYRMHNNTIMTQSYRMIVLDWEEAAGGDPAYDVGYAFAYLRAEFGEKAADRFVREYLEYSENDLAKRLLFYN